ncbi:MAG: hypothetical protein HYV97_11320 [Bdellovibrio sp.]|nr:hypothetical protein [Bdellovibrio sp.]
MKLAFLLFVLLIQSATGLASTLEGFAGANYTSYDAVSEANEGGLSLRFKYNHSKDGPGYFFYNVWRGGGIANYDALLGYSYRSKGNLFFEIGAGAFYGPFGPGIGIVAGSGFWLGNDFYFSLPLIVRKMGLDYMTISPMIGWNF